MIDARLAFPGPPAIVPESTALVRTELPRRPERWERIVLHSVSAAVQPRNLRGVGVATTASIAPLFLGMPWLAPLILGAGFLHYAARVAVTALHTARAERARGALALPLALDVEPHEIWSSELRSSYEGIVRVHEDVRCSLLAADRTQTLLHRLFDQCITAVQASGRLARMANPLHRYIDAHGAHKIKDELSRLAGNADSTSDPLARGVYRNAAAARGRQLGTLLEIENLRDRIRARLELTRASLESVLALVIKLQAIDLEQIEVAGESMSAQIGSLGEELAVLETAIDEEL